MAQTHNLPSVDNSYPAVQKRKGLKALWRVSNYSLRAKFIIAFLLISLFSLGAIALFTNQIVTATLTQNAGADLQNLAELQAVTVGDLLSLQLGALQSLGLSRNIENRLNLVNTRPGAGLSQIQAELAKLDEVWINANDDSTVLQLYLNNSVAAEMKAFQGVFPDHIEIFVTDIYGGLVGATNRTSDFFQADETWWQAAYNNGSGSIYIGEPVIDESSDTYSLVMAIPLYDKEGSLAGILRSTYNLASLSALMGQAGARFQDVHLDLLLLNNQVFNAESIRLGRTDPITPEIADQLEAATGRPYSEFVFEDELSFVSQAPVNSTTDDPAVANLGWKLIAHQPRQTALAPAQAQSRITILWGLAVVVAAIIMAVFVGQRLARPITQLTAVVKNVAAGDWSIRAPVESADEVGVLATAFNSMTTQLHETIDTLEEKVAERTRQLETVVEIGRRLSAILDLSDLMRQVVTLTKETFDYYHVHIYLLEDNILMMAEGYGEAGTEMKRRGHSIPTTALKSLVARAAREGDIVTVENVREDPDWLPNPLLPDTYSEIAVPVRLASEVVGVLDVQSDKIGGLTRDDEVALQALADQIAIAFRNARQFTQTQTALYEAQKLQRRYTIQAWEKFSTGQATTDYEVHEPGLPALDQTPTPEVLVALQQKRTVDLHVSGSTNGADAKDNNGASEVEENKESNVANALATPLKLRNEIIGVLGLQDKNPNRRWTEEEITLIEAVSEQMSLAIENARLFDHTQQRAQREALTRQIADKIRSAGNVEEILQTTVTELSRALGVSRAFIDLTPDTKPAPDNVAVHEG